MKNVFVLSVVLVGVERIPPNVLVPDFVTKRWDRALAAAVRSVGRRRHGDFLDGVRRGARGKKPVQVFR